MRVLDGIKVLEMARVPPAEMPGMGVLTRIRILLT